VNFQINGTSMKKTLLTIDWLDLLRIFFVTYVSLGILSGNRRKGKYAIHCATASFA
jgi:hypothetical protein